MSVIETLAVLYGNMMTYDPKSPDWEGRDYLIMSKGHAGPALFATLALKGFFPIEWLDTLSEPKTRLPSHCDRLTTPGVDVSTGSLGQGLSLAAGLAHGWKFKEMDNYVYTILGDGETQEGQIWEAAAYASNHNLDHMIVFIDWNKRQVDGYLSQILDMGDLHKKFECFGWHAQTVQGNDVASIQAAIENAQQEKSKPSVIVLDGVKGSGVKEFEELELNHHFNLDPDDADKVIAELETQLGGNEYV